MKDIGLVKSIQKDASIFLDHSLALKQVSQSNDDMQKITVLDANLKLWVEIDTTLQKTNNILPEEIKQNLKKLSQFVEHMILSKGLNMTSQNYECLVNINMQISQGLSEAVKNYMAREEAFSLLKCAVDIANAKDKNDPTALVNALDNNLKLWIHIKTVVSAKKSNLPDELKTNLIKLSDYISSQTIRVGQDLDQDNFTALDSIISTNLQITEGLMTYDEQKAA